MENMGVLIVYIVVFLFLCVLLVRAAKGDRDWGRLFGLELLAVVASFCAIHIFDALPGRGMMPGLTWFGAVLYSMGAVAVYAVLLLITVVVWALKHK